MASQELILITMRLHAKMAGKDFMFGGCAVGTFEDSALPSGPGRYKYEPYRGAGHYEMQEQLGVVKWTPRAGQVAGGF